MCKSYRRLDAVYCVDKTRDDMFFLAKKNLNKNYQKLQYVTTLLGLATLLTWAVQVEALNCDTVVILLTCQNSSSFKTFRLALPH